jgi:hypothetical protein
MTESKLTPGNSWQPAADVITHAGSPVTVDADFFMPPPPEIGELISVGTDLPKSKNPMPKALRLIIIAASMLVLPIFLQIVWQTIWLTVIAGLVAGVVAWYFTRFDHTCSFVGSKGLVKYELMGDRTTLPTETFLMFTDAHSLYTKTTRNYTNGVYTGTEYNYKWVKNSGNDFIISGTYKGENTPPKPQDLWHFANVGESAWTQYLLENIDDQLAKDGYIEFALSGALQAVRVGQGFLEFVSRKDGIQRVMREDMRDITLGSGTFQFKHQDARWWSGKGKFSFDYGNIPNARIFMICLKELADIYWD